MLTTTMPKPVVRSCQEAGTTPQSPKRLAIVQAATQLFLNKGYDAVSMDLISETAKVSKRTVYSHFSNKETLFGAVMQAMCRRFNQSEPDGSPLDGPPEETLVALGIDILTLLTSPEGIALFRVVTAEAPRNPKLAEVFSQNGPDSFCDYLATYLIQQTEAGTLKVEEPDFAALQFWMLIKAPFHLKLLLCLETSPDAAMIDASVRKTVASFLKMYRL